MQASQAVIQTDINSQLVNPIMCLEEELLLAQSKVVHSQAVLKMHLDSQRRIHLQTMGPSKSSPTSLGQIFSSRRSQTLVLEQNQ